MIDVMNPEQLSQKALTEFKTAYKEEFCEELTDEEAHAMAVRLLRFFGILVDSD